MKIKQLLTKSLLVAVCLLAGQSVWAVVTPVSQDYSDGIADWTSGSTGRYTVGITDGILSVNPVSNGNNGTTITGTTVKDKVPQGTDFASSDDYTLSFDLKLKCGNNNTSSFYIYDGTNKESAAILALNPRDANGTNWKINGNIHNSVKLSSSTLYTFKLSKSGQYLYLTITPAEGGNPVFAQQTINVNSSKGGLGNMSFSTGRYYAGMSIDNVVLRAIESTDIPASAKTYSVKAKAGDTVLKTYIASGAAAAGASVKVSCLNWAVTKDGKWYTLNDANVTNFTRTFTKGSSDNEELVIEYKLDESIAYYTEAEDLSGWYAQEQKADYSSYGLSKFLGTASKSDTECSVTTSFYVSAGKYDICASIFHRTKDGNVESLNVYEVGGGDPVSLGTIGGEAGKQTEATIMKLTNQTLTNGSDIKIAGTYNNSSSTTCFDYIYLQKSAVSYTVEYKCGATTIKDADASRTASWGTTVELSDEDKADVTFEGKKYSYSSDNASSTTIASDGTSVITVNFDCLGKAETVTYTLNVGGATEDKTKETITSTNESTSTSLNTLVGITNNTGGNYGTGDKKDLTVKIPTDTEYNAEHYMSVGFTVASGCKFTPTSISVTAQPVTTNKTVKLVLTDGTNSIEKTQEDVASGTPAEIIENNSGATSLTGDVTLKIYCYGATDTYRLGSPITIEGLLDYNDDIKSAIADCKAWETSSEFATYIDGGSYASAEEVYAAHTAWQVANGTASKAILNNTVTSADHFWGTLKEGANYDGAPDTKYLSNDAEYNVHQIVYGLPAGTYEVSAWTYVSDENYRKLYIADISTNPWTDLVTPYTSEVGWQKLSGTFTITKEADIAFGFYCGAIANGTSGFDNWNLELTSVPATITAAGWATLYSPYALNFAEANPSGLKAYTATTDGVSVTLTPVSNVPANTGVVLEGSAGNYSIPVIASSGTDKGGLQGSATEATACPAETGYTYYILTLAQNGVDVQFNPATSGSIAAGRAFLKVATPGAAKALSVMFANDPTGIANVNAAEVAQPIKRIVNGQLVIEKNGKRYNAAGAEF